VARRPVARPSIFTCQTVIRTIDDGKIDIICHPSSEKANAPPPRLVACDLKLTGRRFLPVPRKAEGVKRREALGADRRTVACHDAAR
jgi:hypothetical protein